MQGRKTKRREGWTQGGREGGGGGGRKGGKLIHKDTENVWMHLKWSDLQRWRQRMKEMIKGEERRGGTYWEMGWRGGGGRVERCSVGCDWIPLFACSVWTEIVRLAICPWSRETGKSVERQSYLFTNSLALQSGCMAGVPQCTSSNSSKDLENSCMSVCHMEFYNYGDLMLCWDFIFSYKSFLYIFG